MSKTVTLDSGAILTITPAPFADAKELYQTILAELQKVKVESKLEMTSLFKDLFCVGFSSASIEASLKKCLARCSYEKGNTIGRILPDTFEPVENREDYIQVCMEVVKENIAPFVKSLYAEFQRLTKTVQSTRA